MTVFLLIRHAETADSGMRLSGRSSGVDLTTTGHRQAERLARRLAASPIATVYSSPRERTCSTAAPLATRLNLPLRTLDDIDELDFGEWQGMSFNALRDDPAWRRFNEHRGATRPPGGELAGEAQERFITAMRHLSTEQPAACVALVSHGDPIRYALARCLGLSLDAVHRLQVDLASVSVVSWEGDARVLCINRSERVPLD